MVLQVLNTSEFVNLITIFSLGLPKIAKKTPYFDILVKFSLF
jgi:hypothetical protein